MTDFKFSNGVCLPGISVVQYVAKNPFVENPRLAPFIMEELTTSTMYANGTTYELKPLLTKSFNTIQVGDFVFVTSNSSYNKDVKGNIYEVNKVFNDGTFGCKSLTYIMYSSDVKVLRKDEQANKPSLKVPPINDLPEVLEQLKQLNNTKDTDMRFYTVFDRDGKINAKSVMYQEYKFRTDSRPFVTKIIDDEIEKVIGSWSKKGLEVLRNNAAKAYDLELVGLLDQIIRSNDKLNEPDCKVGNDEKVNLVIHWYAVQKMIKQKRKFLWIEELLTKEVMNSKEPVILFSSNKYLISVFCGKIKYERGENLTKSTNEYDPFNFQVNNSTTYSTAIKYNEKLDKFHL